VRRMRGVGHTPPLAATPKFEVKRHGALSHSNDCIAMLPSGYSALNFAGSALSQLLSLERLKSCPLGLRINRAAHFERPELHSYSRVSLAHPSR